MRATLRAAVALALLITAAACGVSPTLPGTPSGPGQLRPDETGGWNGSGNYNPPPPPKP